MENDIKKLKGDVKKLQENSIGVIMTHNSDVNVYRALERVLAGRMNLSIGVPVPTARLHIGAGTTSSYTAPIKLTSGALMLTTEVGAIEFLTDNLYFTITTGAARKRIALVAPSGGLTAGRVPFVGTGGQLTDSAAMTFAGTTLTVTDLVVGNDATVTNLMTADTIVGTTSIQVGTVAGYLSSDGSTGKTGSFTTVDGKTITVKDGIITAIV